MSVAFTALHQTLKSDPKMTNIIYKILTTNYREQYKDNNFNDHYGVKAVINALEFNEI
jgi:hypothetical protein